MKYIKKYEKYSQIGDYVVFNFDETKGNIKFRKYLNNTIGQIVYVKDIFIKVKYDNIPPEMKEFFEYNNGTKLFDKKFILETSKNKEYLIELIKAKNIAKNYNL